MTSRRAAAGRGERLPPRSAQPWPPNSPLGFSLSALTPVLPEGREELAELPRRWMCVLPVPADGHPEPSGDVHRLHWWGPSPRSSQQRDDKEQQHKYVRNTCKCVFRTPAWKSVLLENLEGKGVLNLNAQKAPAESSLAPTRPASSLLEENKH